MSRYFYDITGDNPFIDREGMEHPSDYAAWREAVKLVRDVEENLRPEGNWMLTVRQDGRIVYCIDVRASCPCQA